MIDSWGKLHQRIQAYRRAVGLPYTETPPELLRLERQGIAEEREFYAAKTGPERAKLRASLETTQSQIRRIKGVILATKRIKQPPNK